MQEASVRARVRFGVFEVNLRSGELRKWGSKIRLQERPSNRLWSADTFVDFGLRSQQSD